MMSVALPVMLMMLAQSALGLPMAATQQELEQFEIIDELVPSFGHRRAQTNSSSTTCDTPIPENGGLGKKGTKFYCPAKMQDGTDCMPTCDEGFTLMISVRQDKIIPNKCREGVLKTKAVCEPVDKCFGPCISRETFENISTTGWVIIAVLAGACLGGCGFMCNRMGYFDKIKSKNSTIWQERNVNDSVRMQQARQHAQKSEAAERKKRGLGHLDAEE